MFLRLQERLPFLEEKPLPCGVSTILTLIPSPEPVSRFVAQATALEDDDDDL
jgi:hypothetical protein